MRTKIIAEISSNHIGDMSLAFEMIAAAAENGADIVKFQSWREETLIPEWPDHDWYKKTELNDNDHFLLKEECEKKGVDFLTTCFDRKRINFLSTLGMKFIKVASPDLASFTMLKELREQFQYIIASTGMSTPEEIKTAASILGKGNFAFLHCVSIYPTPVEKLNLRKIEWLKNFTKNVGLSDHSLGITGAMIAVARGVSFVEKHFTLDQNLPGKDHKISILPNELKALSDFRNSVAMADGKELTLTLSDEEIKTKEKFTGRWGNNK